MTFHNKSKSETTMQHLFASLKRHHDRSNLELRRLCKRKRFADACELMTDRLHQALNYLCHYKAVVKHDGFRESILEVIEELSKHVNEAYTEMTGREYTPVNVRTRDLARKKLLRAVRRANR